MLAVPADRLPGAIGDLDPGNRALLDLSLRRGVSDAEIGELLRKEPSDVARGRDAVLELLADALDVNGHDRRERVRTAVAALPDDAWQVRAPAPPPQREPVEPAAEPVPDEEEPAGAAEAAERDRERAAAARELDDDLVFDEPEEERRSRRGALFAVLGLAAVVVVLIVVLSSGGDDDDSGTSQGNGSQPPAQNGGPAPKGNSQKLTPVGNAKGEGTVTVTDDGATIAIRGLAKPDGSYQVWLYNDIVDAQSLGTISGGSGKLDVKLPPEARKYAFIDVSNEPSDANPNHSGASVLRAQLDGLLND